MGESIYRGFTVVALSLIAMTWLLAWLYIRVSNRQHTALQVRSETGLGAEA